MCGSHLCFQRPTAGEGDRRAKGASGCEEEERRRRGEGRKLGEEIVKGKGWRKAGGSSRFWMASKLLSTWVGQVSKNPRQRCGLLMRKKRLASAPPHLPSLLQQDGTSKFICPASPEPLSARVPLQASALQQPHCRTPQVQVVGDGFSFKVQTRVQFRIRFYFGGIQENASATIAPGPFPILDPPRQHD